jgi:probable O-glycosylation ligase (exosortase A-associated)
MASVDLQRSARATHGRSTRGAAPYADLRINQWPFVMFVAYVAIEFVRPQYFVPAIGLLRPGLLLAVALTLWWITAHGLKQLFADRLITLFFMFTAMAVIWVPFAVNNYWAFQRAQFLVITLLSATVPLSLMLVPSVRRRQFINFWIAAHTYLALFSMTHSGRGPGSFLGDENDLALALCMSLPYPLFLAQRLGESRLVQLIYYVAALLMILGIVWTNSRGGFVGLVTVVVYVLWLSKHKIRNLLIVAALGLATYTFAPSGYFDEVESINDTTDSTRVGRLLQWRIGWAMFADNPIVGVGTANYAWRALEYHRTLPDYDPAGRQYGGRAAHSLYFTVLPEFGLVGTTVFALIVVGLFRRLNQCERRLAAEPDDPDAAKDVMLTKAIRASVIGYLSAGAFISVLYYPLLWYAVGFAIALSRDGERRRLESSAHAT